MAEWTHSGGHPYLGGESSQCLYPPTQPTTDNIRAEKENTPIEMEGAEKSRTYLFPRVVKSNGDVIESHEITINFPVRLTVRPSGSHIVEDYEGITHYIPSGWIKLSWQGKHDFNVDSNNTYK